MRDAWVDAPPGLRSGIPLVAGDDALDETVSGDGSGESDEGQKTGKNGQSRIHSAFILVQQSVSWLMLLVGSIRLQSQDTRKE